MPLDYSLLNYDYIDEHICVKTLTPGMNPEDEKFIYSYNPETKILNVSRAKYGAWNYNLKIFIFSKQNKKHKLFEFGPIGHTGNRFRWHMRQGDVGRNYSLEVNFDDINSTSSCLVKTENFLNSGDLISHLNESNIKNYLALTVTPADYDDIKDFEPIENLLFSQSCIFEKIFITVREEYKEFSQLIKPRLLKLFNQYPNIDIIYIPKDYDEASSYIGPLLHRSEEIANNRVILINNNVMYDSNFLRNFLLAFETYEDLKFIIGYPSELNLLIDKSNEIEFKIKKGSVEDAQLYGYGHLYLDSFAGSAFKLNENEIRHFCNYFLKIFENIPDSFQYTQSIVKTYLNFLNEEVVQMTHGAIDYHATCKYKEGMFTDLSKNSKANYANLLKKIEEEIYNYTVYKDLLS